MPDEEIKKPDPMSLSTADLWENIGFHRPLAGFFYNLPLYLITLILGIVVTGFIFSLLYPFPESMGYKAAATAIFGLFFQVFDLGTSNIMNRYIGETNIKNPQKMVQYIQYFIWYQMITGLLQTTAVSMYAIFIVPRSQLSYAVWIMLIHSTTQYPGFLGVFRNTLNSLQQYHKTAVLNFISGEFFQRVTEIAFVLLGRWYGMNNPAVGEIMGIAIGATIGFYIDDFIATAFSAHFFQKLMKGYGFTVRDCFRHDFDRKMLKECLAWGIKSGLPGMVWTVQVYISLMLWLNFVPQYTTFLALASFAGSIGSLMGWTLDLGGCISEAFYNGKKQLAKYYISQAWRYTGLIQSFMFALLSLVLLVIEPILIFFNLQYYLLSISFIFPRMIRDIQQPYNNFAANTYYGTGYINTQMIMQFYEAGVAIVSWFIFIVWLKLPQTYGMIAIAWLIPCGELPAIASKVAINYLVINKKIIKIKIPVYQAFIGPLMATFIIFLLGLLYVNFVFNPINEVYGTLAAFIPTALICFIVIPFFVYFPLTGFLGVWDDSSLEILRKATKMSGMGKFFSLPMYKMLRFTKKSKLFGKFGIDYSEAIKEGRELMVLKNENRVKKIPIA
ncbi:MAG: hypothetical protein ACFFCS_08725 [Candidatus Hodarchaeota archaeon]